MDGDSSGESSSGKLSSGQAEIMLELEPRRVTLPDVTLAGCSFEQKVGTLPWKKHVPWYKLAQAIYKTGPNFKARMIAGNNTFTLLRGAEAFAAVQISRSFESYPEELQEQVLPAREYLVFAAWIDPEIVTRKKLPSQKLYNAAIEYVARHHCPVEADFRLEREYRADGQNVDRIELYVPLL